MKRAFIRRISLRRLEETSHYHFRRRQFLLLHPYCQVWLSEHGVDEEDAVYGKGTAFVQGELVSIPLSTEIHHKNKRRGQDLLSEEHWMAVSRDAHRRIEENKAWARAMGFLLPF